MSSEWGFFLQLISTLQLNDGRSWLLIDWLSFPRFSEPLDWTATTTQLK